MAKCKVGNCDLFDGENVIGKPLEYDICTPCWEDLSEAERKKFIQDGVIPITRSIITDEWRVFCKKYGMTP